MPYYDCPDTNGNADCRPKGTLRIFPKLFHFSNSLLFPSVLSSFYPSDGVLIIRRYTAQADA